MSTVYATEPPPSGRVIIETTHGPLDVQLWCKECPETTRHFLQLCRDGYYDDRVFHRIVPKFLIQTGAVRKPASAHSSNKRNGGGALETPLSLSEALEKEAASRRNPPHASSLSTSSLYASYRKAIHADRALERRRYEVHSRLRFSHWGIVAMALTVPGNEDEDEQDNEWMQPQFFVTLDEAPFLDGKHVVFGTCVGPTYFNAVRISQVDVDDATHQPANEWWEAPTVLRVKIVEAPSSLLESLVEIPVAKIPWKQSNENDSLTGAAESRKKKKRKGRLDMNVLSFGDEVEDDVVVKSPVSKRAHPINDRAALAASADDQDRVETLPPPTQQQDKVGSSEVKAHGGISPPSPVQRRVHDDDGETRPKHNDTSAPQIPSADQDAAVDRAPDDGPSVGRAVATQSKTVSVVEARKAGFAARRAAMAKVRGTGAATDDKKQREDDTMAKLAAFQSNLKRSAAASTTTATTANGGSDKGGGLASRMARRAQGSSRGGDTVGADVPTYHGQVFEDEDDDKKEGRKPGNSDWMRTKFRCRRFAAADGGGDALMGGDGRHADDYQVLDDRNQKRHHVHHHRSRDGTERHHHRHSHREGHDDTSRRHKDHRPSAEDRHHDRRHSSKHDKTRER